MKAETYLRRYAAMAEQYLRHELPARYQQIQDPVSHFQALAAQIEQRVQAEEQRLKRDPTASRDQSMREQAERAVCSDLSWLLRAHDRLDPEGRTDETGAYLGWTDPALQAIRAPSPDLADWELAEIDSGRDPETGQPLLTDREITRHARRNRRR